MLNIQRYTAILLSMVSMRASFGLSIEAQLLAILDSKRRVLTYNPGVTNEDISKIGVDGLKKYIKEIRTEYQVKESDRVIVELKPVSNQGPSIYITDRVFGTDYNSKGLYICEDSNQPKNLTEGYKLASGVRIEKIIIVPDVIVPPVSDEGVRKAQV